MKWFKHLSGSLNDSFIFELIEKFGGDGYLVFFGTIELMADEFDINNPGISQFSVGKLTKNLQISRRKVTKVLSFTTEKERLIANINGDVIILNCPRLKDLCDEWTQRQLRSYSEVTPKLLRSSHAPVIEVEVEVDTKEKYIKESVKKVLDYLNEITGKNYRMEKHISARLNEGSTIDDCIRVIDFKAKDKYFQADNYKLLNPETLFRPEKFGIYINQSIPKPESKPSPEPKQPKPDYDAYIKNLLDDPETKEKNDEFHQKILEPLKDENNENYIYGDGWKTFVEPLIRVKREGDTIFLFTMPGMVSWTADHFLDKIQASMDDYAKKKHAKKTIIKITSEVK